MKAVSSIKTWRLLHALNKTGALTSAAQQESIELSEASRRIAALESELGLILLDRRKKPAQLTEAAKRLDGQASRISRAHKSAMELAEKIKQEEAKHTTQRTVRISLPVNFDKVGLLSALYEYESRHENIRFEFSADSGIPALLEGSTDISMGGYLWDGKGVFALPVGRCFNFLMASESYIKRYGLPESIQDLLNGKHRLLMRNPKNRFFSNKLTNGRQTVYVGPHANVFYGDAEACREMLVTGGGIATDLSVGYVSEFIANSTIHAVLPGWHREPWTFYVYCRAAHSEDKLIREVMALIAKSAFAQISNRWEFWYKRLGLPLPEELDYIGNRKKWL